MAAPRNDALGAAMQLHRRGQTEPAIASYRALLSQPDTPLHQVRILLANLLLTAPSPSPDLKSPRHAEALVLAAEAAAAAPSVTEPRDRAVLLAR